MDLKSRKRVLNARKALQYRLKATYKGDLRRAKKWERIWQKRINRLSDVEYLQYIDAIYYRWCQALSGLQRRGGLGQKAKKKKEEKENDTR